MNSHSSPQSRGESGEFPNLDIHDWDAPSKICNGDNESVFTSSPAVKEFLDFENLTYSQIIELLEEKIQVVAFLILCNGIQNSIYILYEIIAQVRQNIVLFILFKVNNNHCF